VSSLDQLNGIPCNSGAGTTQLSYGSGGAVSITCVTPTPTTSPTIVPSPANSCNSAHGIGTLGAGNTATETGVNVGNSAAWYVVTFTTSSFTFTVGGTPVPGIAAGSDVMNVYTSCGGAALASDVTSYTGTASGTYFVQVIEGSSGVDGGFTLTASGS
jgi:hypothetical protein